MIAALVMLWKNPLARYAALGVAVVFAVRLYSNHVAEDAVRGEKVKAIDETIKPVTEKLDRLDQKAETDRQLAQEQLVQVQTEITQGIGKMRLAQQAELQKGLAAIKSGTMASDKTIAAIPASELDAAIKFKIEELDR